MAMRRFAPWAAALAVGVGVGYVLPHPDPSEYDSVAFLVAALEREGLRCGGDLSVQVSRDAAMDLDRFETGSCPTFDGDDQADFYIFDGGETLKQWYQSLRDRRSAGVSGVLGSNWFISVRSETTAREIAAAIGGETTGY